MRTALSHVTVLVIVTAAEDLAIAFAVRHVTAHVIVTAAGNPESAPSSIKSHKNCHPLC